jgi:hypothetical protein
MERLLAVNPSEAPKLSQALGRLMLRKTEVEVNLWSLRREYNDQHPDVKRAVRKAEMFEAAIKEILPAK